MSRVLPDPLIPAPIPRIVAPPPPWAPAALPPCPRALPPCAPAVVMERFKPQHPVHNRAVLKGPDFFFC